MKPFREFWAGLRTRAVARPWMSATMALAGLGMALLMVANPGPQVFPIWVPPAMVLGGTLLGWVVGTFVMASSIPTKNAEFWETGAIGRLGTSAAFAACASLGWGFFLWVAFGTIDR